MTGSARKWLITGILAAVVAFSGAAMAGGMATPRLKPPAPEPVYLTQGDHALLSALADSLKKKRFPEARELMGRIGDPTARSLGQWMYFRAEDPAVGIAEADAFLDAHKDWPATYNIQKFIEGKLKSTTPVKDVLAFFDTRDPVSGDGRIALAHALFAEGENEAASIHLREAWVNYNFTVSEERRILSAYGGRLSTDDHAARVDRLLWERQVTNARRIFSRLDAKHRRMAEARAALLLRAATAPKIYRSLPAAEQLDSGVLMAATRYYRRSGDEKKAIELSALAPADPETLRNPGRWWYERQLLMRVSLKEGRFADAYALAANNGLNDPGELAEAEFNAGWIALRFLQAPERAETHFLALASAVGTPISLSRANYWLGRAAKAQGDAKMATSYFEEAAKYYYSFYGQLAAEELGDSVGQYMFGPIAVATSADQALFSSRPTVAALKMLSDLDLDYEFMVFAYHIDDQLERPGEYVELAKLTDGQGAPHLTVRAGKVAVQRDAFAANVAYPLIFVPDEAKEFVPPELILGLSRQESEFNPRAFSHAGARGMMQLIPATALITARKEGLTYSRTALLDDPVYNLTLGSAHLSHLIEDFDGSLPLTLSAYNAGPQRAARWIEEYGDPRSPNVDPLDWIELVPFSETRNYIQRVLENTQVYRGQLNKAPIPGRLSADVESGGPLGRVARNPVPSGVLMVKSAQQGPQVMAPLPALTAKRVAEYKTKLAARLAAAEPQPTLAADETASETATGGNKKQKRSERRRSRSTPARNKKTGADPQTSTENAGGRETLSEPAVKAVSDRLDDNAATAATDSETETTLLPVPERPAPIALSLEAAAERPLVSAEPPSPLVALPETAPFGAPAEGPASSPAAAANTSSAGAVMDDAAMAALIAEARAVIAAENGTDPAPEGNDINDYIAGSGGAPEDEHDECAALDTADGDETATDDLAAALNAGALADFNGAADPCAAENLTP